MVRRSIGPPRLADECGASGLDHHLRGMTARVDPLANGIAAQRRRRDCGILIGPPLLGAPVNRSRQQPPAPAPEPASPVCAPNAESESNSDAMSSLPGQDTQSSSEPVCLPPYEEFVNAIDTRNIDGARAAYCQFANS